MSDVETIEQMTPFEYELQMEAAELRELDRKHTTHEMAWAYMAVQQTNSSGDKLKYNTFDKFFENSYKKAFNEVKERTNPDVRMSVKNVEKEYNLDLLDKLERRVNG